jgi:hypothetical protein
MLRVNVLKVYFCCHRPALCNDGDQNDRINFKALLRRFKFALSPLLAKPVPSMQSVLKPIDGQINLPISACISAR